MSDEERPRGVKLTELQESDSSNETKDSPTPGQSDAKRAKRITQEEKEDSMLPDLKPAPGKIILFLVYDFIINQFSTEPINRFCSEICKINFSQLK